MRSQQSKITPPPFLPAPCSSPIPFAVFREVRLPGKDASSPEVFPFGTPYRDIYDTLKGKDETFFLQNNLLPLVARNATIKAAPERFQEIEGTDMAGFDVVLCFESRVFYLVVEGTYACRNAALSRTSCGRSHHVMNSPLRCQRKSDPRILWSCVMFKSVPLLASPDLSQVRIHGSQDQHHNPSLPSTRDVVKTSGVSASRKQVKVCLCSQMKVKSPT